MEMPTFLVIRHVNGYQLKYFFFLLPPEEATKENLELLHGREYRACLGLRHEAEVDKIGKRVLARIFPESGPDYDTALEPDKSGEWSGFEFKFFNHQVLPKANLVEFSY